MIQFDEEKHIYTIDGVIIPGVTEILAPITAGGYLKINPAVLEHAAMKGTLVHAWCEMYDYDCAEESVPTELIPYCQAYADFVRDYRPQYESIEAILFNPEENYAGRVDRAGRFGNGSRDVFVMDIKTIASPSTKTHIAVCCQTAAYARAIGCEEYAGRYALYLKPDGTYKLFDCREYEEKQGFSGLDIFYKLLSLKMEIERIGRKK